MYKGYRVSAVIPAFNEALAIGKVVSELLALQGQGGLRAIDEVVVCDDFGDVALAGESNADNYLHVACHCETFDWHCTYILSDQGYPVNTNSIRLIN